MAEGKVDLRNWNRLYARVRAEAGQDARVKVGVLASAGQHDSGISMAELAAIHEFGSPAAGIPERSFLRHTFQAREEDIRKIVRKLAAQFVKAGMPLDQALGLLGQWLVAQVRSTITSHIPPPLKPATIKRKGSTTPLVDTGQLINSISYQIVGVNAPEGEAAGGMTAEVVVGGEEGGE